MTLPDTSRLAIAEIVFYIPTLALSILIVIRHGFKRQLGWIYLSILGVIRIVGNSMEISANQKHDNTLFIIAAVLNGVGLSPLLLAMVGLLQRVNEGIMNSHANGNGGMLQGPLSRALRLIHLPIIVALVLAAVGSSKLYGTDPSSHADGEHLARAGISVFIVSFAGLAAVTFTLVAYMLLRDSGLKTGERRILFAVAASIPFIAVRLIYSALVYFDTSSSVFTLRGGNIWAQAFMSVAEEWITVVLYLTAGLLAPPATVHDTKVPLADSGYDLEMESRAAPPVYDPRNGAFAGEQVSGAV
ncbi:MAG: hypothetical protein Q9220_002047 [cf. Caloplaca sp. 1 TL-2023]